MVRAQALCAVVACALVELGRSPTLSFVHNHIRPSTLTAYYDRSNPVAWTHGFQRLSLPSIQIPLVVGARVLPMFSSLAVVSSPRSPCQTVRLHRTPSHIERRSLKQLRGIERSCIILRY